ITINGSQAKIDGTQTQNKVSPPPPSVAFPQITYDQQSWINAGYTIQSYASCSTAASFITNPGTSSTNYAVRITPACTLTLNAATVNLYGDLAVINDGSIQLKNVVFQSGDGNQHKLEFIVPWSSPQTCGDFSTTAQTTITHLLFFVYTPCSLSVSNNSAGDGAQLFGKNVSILN